MPSINDMISNVMLRMGDPRSQRVGVAQILNQLMTQTRTVLRHKHNTGNVWNYNDTVIDVVPGLATYAIIAADFGTPLAVISYAPQLATYIARLIPMRSPQNMAYSWGWPNSLASAAFLPADGSQCTAQNCSIYWRDNQPYIDFEPTPQQNAAYQVKFLQSSASTYTDALTASPAWVEDCDLIECRAALALLPLAEWMAPDSKDGRSYNAERRRDLAASLSAEERELTRQFEAAALNYTGSRIYDRWNPVVG